MRKLIFAILCSLGVVNALAGPDLQVGDVVRFFDREGSTGGGEFGVRLVSNLGAPDLFRTFCVETNENLDFSNNFRVGSITSDAINGGSGGGSPDPLSYYSAYLYSQFRAGTLSGYDYTAGSAAHIAAADALQNALWFFENESSSSSAARDAFIQAAVNAVGLSFGGFNPVGTPTWGQTLGNVRVANMLWDSNGNRAQDVLVLIPIPGAAFLGVLGLGIAGWVKRRMA